MPHLNVEIKARCANPARVRNWLTQAGARYVGEDHQVDTYFDVPHGRLKLRQGTIEYALIQYDRPDQAGPKVSQVRLTQVPREQGPALLAQLTAALGVKVTVDKRRHIYFIGNVKFHIDTVAGLGNFMEIEAIDADESLGETHLRQQCDQYMAELEIVQKDLLTQSYSDMMRADPFDSALRAVQGTHTDPRTTEQPSAYDHLETMTVAELLAGINREDHRVPVAIAGALPQIETAVSAIEARMKQGGRLFYLGAGTSGRLGVVDASECPPTYGVPHGLVVGLIAGGDTAIRRAVEGAEDDTHQGWQDLLAYQPTPSDSVIGLSASGTTPYVLAALTAAREHGLLTGCIVCNAHSPIAAACEVPMTVVAGPEFVTGSTRMKSGTAQKLVLNMLSTALMIRLGHVRGNRMVDMALSNAKLVIRGTRMVMEATGLPENEAKALLIRYGSVRAAVENLPE